MTQPFLSYVRSAAVLMLLSASGVRAEVADLTGEVWSVCGWDGFTSWHDTRLVFTKQTTDKKGAVVSGYFDWVGDEGSFGREHFEGMVSETGALSLQGLSMENGSAFIITSRYEGQLTSDGTKILDGVWLDGEPGIWAAVRDGGQGTAAGFCQIADTVS